MLDGQSLDGGVYNGGAGIDTIEARPLAAQTVSNHLLRNFSEAGLVSIERLQFATLANTRVTVSINYDNLATSGLTELIGNAGNDTLFMLIGTAGTYTMPLLTLTNWTSTVDGIGLQVASTVTGNVTLTARDNYGTIQILRGGVGNDTLNGSNGIDQLVYSGGTDQLLGNGGNDNFFIQNIATPNGIGGYNPPSFLAPDH